MVAIRINGQEAPINGNSGLKVVEMVELIKNTIDPDHMITGVTINGDEVDSDDWDSPVSKFGETPIIEVETGRPSDYVRQRISIAPNLVQQIFMEFREARKCFQNGTMKEGNEALMAAVNDFKAFFEWYGCLKDLIPESERANYDITPQTEEITSICKRICQQQLYQSWWALGESIAKELEPAIDRLEDFLRKLSIKQ